MNHIEPHDEPNDDKPRLAVRIGAAWLLAFVALGLAGWTGEYVESALGFGYYARYGLQALIMTGLIVPGILWMRRNLDRAPLAGLGLPDVGTSVRSAAIGMGFIALPLVAIVVLAQLLGWADVSFNTGNGVLGAALFGVFTVIFFEALPEELAFRGYIYRNLNTRMSRWSAGAVAVALFVLLPVVLVTFEERVLGMDVVVGGASGLTGGYLITMVIFGSFVQYLRILTGTVWTSVGFHFAFVYINRLIGPGPNDLIQFGDVTAPGAMQITAIAIVGLLFIGAIAYPWIRGRPVGWKDVQPEPAAA
ncbi:MAG TPA: CPBP family glutamic-type intramembrane protease [Gemmatimonadota bacterium]|nr:CPBP family glutamic-type intramembrane protease [Gemmatimonadota bacterium]